MNEIVNNDKPLLTSINRNQVRYQYYFKRFTVPFILLFGLIFYFLGGIDQQIIIINGNRVLNLNGKYVYIFLIIGSAPALFIAMKYFLGFRNNQRKAKNNDDINTIIGIEKACFGPLIILGIIVTFFILLPFMIWFYKIRKRAII